MLLVGDVVHDPLNLPEPVLPGTVMEVQVYDREPASADIELGIEEALLPHPAFTEENVLRFEDRVP